MSFESTIIQLQDMTEQLFKNAVCEVSNEAVRAFYKHGKFNSDHEAYAVLLEEVEEYWEEVRRNDSLRSKSRMRAELVQVAAVAIKAIVTIDGNLKMQKRRKS